MSEPQLPQAAGIFVSFVTLLRLNGFAVAPEQTVAFLAAIELLGPRGIDDIHRAGLATLEARIITMRASRSALG